MYANSVSSYVCNDTAACQRVKVAAGQPFSGHIIVRSETPARKHPLFMYLDNGTGGKSRD